MTNQTLKIFAKNWLIHLLIVLAVINLFDSIDYIVRSTGGGWAYSNPDGSPVTLWQRFIDHNFRRSDNLYIIAFTFLTELNYQFVYNRVKWYFFLGVTFLLSAIIVFITSVLKPDHSGAEIWRMFVPIA